MIPLKEEEIRKVVRKGYAKIAKKSSSCCAPVAPCCGSANAALISKKMGYTEKELETVPEGANLGLGCGNPVALASLKEGETVLDLGSGAGFDCFLAANKVGKKGKIIGVDMTPEMIEKARENAKKGNYSNVEFRLGEIENIPAADGSVDAVISNCVINLSPNKKKVFEEGFRVLKPGGRLMVSDIVLLKELPASIKNSLEAYVSCIPGAMIREEYLRTIENAGFKEVKIVDETIFPIDPTSDTPSANAIFQNPALQMKDVEKIKKSILSIKVNAIKR
jgi:SAM-dependent methyltransferase